MSAQIYQPLLALTLCLTQLLLGPLSAGKHHLEPVHELYRQQKHDEAWKLFLKLLAEVPEQPALEPLSGEKILYEAAFKSYCQASFSDCCDANEEIICKYEPVIEAYKEYYHLQLIVAAAYANKGDFEHFFDLFYHSYPHCQGHYIAHKVRAVLALKIFEGLMPGEEKEKMRKIALAQLRQAENCYPQDIALYRLQIIYSAPNDYRREIKRAVEAMVERSVCVSRKHIPFFGEKLALLSDLSLTHAFLTAMRQQHGFSRHLQQIAENLNNSAR